MGIGEGKSELITECEWSQWNGKRVREQKSNKTKSKPLGAALGAQSRVWGWGVLLVRVGWLTAGRSGHWVRRSPGSQRATSIHKSAKLCAGCNGKWGCEDPGFGEGWWGISGPWSLILVPCGATLAVGGQWGTQGCVAAWNGLMSPETSHVTSVLLSVAKKLRKLRIGK